MKKKLKTLSLILIAITGLTSCKSEKFEPAALASLNVVNTILDGKPVRLNTNLRDSVAVMNFKLFSIAPGTASPIKAFASSSPNSPYFSQNLDIKGGEIYSLFLSGSTATSVDGILLKEEIRSFTDSTTAVRFINLVQNSQPISVNITGSANGGEVANLAYKANSGFKNYDAKKVNNTYSFQIRDAALGTILGSYTLTVPRFRSCTLAWKGTVGGTGTTAPGILRINHY